MSLLDHGVVEATPDQALDREQRILGIGDRLPLGRHADQDLAIFRVGHHRGGRAHPLLVLDHAAFLPSMMATQLFVVPRSIPMILLILSSRVRREIPRPGEGAAGEGSSNRWQAAERPA